MKLNPSGEASGGSHKYLLVQGGMYGSQPEGPTDSTRFNVLV
jgi:hypothetical protein